ncbi:MAG: septum formation initiator family protein [Desulfitobacterium hafniense]|nr:septum formation initiator family protein [Desulfitobacterium hafniense]
MTKKTRRARKIRLRPLGFLVLCFAMTVAASSFLHLWKLYSDVHYRLNELNQEKAVLIKNQQKLKEEIVQLNTPSYIEQLAREQLGLVRRGEILIAPKQ